MLDECLLKAVIHSSPFITVNVTHSCEVENYQYIWQKSEQHGFRKEYSLSRMIC